MSSHNETGWTAAIVKDMKVLALRTELKNRGLSPSGLKSVLVRRLLRALKAEGIDVGEFSEEDEQLGVDHTEEETPSWIGRWRRLGVSNKFRGIRHATQRVVHLPEQQQVWLLGDLQDSVINYSSEPMQQSALITTGVRFSPVLKAFSATRMGENSIICFGGSVEHPVASSFSDVWLLDIPSKRWTKVATRNPPPAPRDSHVAVEVGGKLFIYGGKSISPQGEICYGDAWVLDTETWTWQQVAVDLNIVKPRYGHSAVYHHDSRCLYIFGGCRSEINPQGVATQVWLHDLFSLNVESGAWTKVETIGQKQQPLAYHTADLIKNRMYIFSGCNRAYNSWQYPNCVDYLELDSLRWRRLATHGRVPMGRYGHQSFVVRSEIFILGGCRVPATRPAASAFYGLNTEWRPTVTIDPTTFDVDMRFLWSKELFSDINFRVQNKYLRAHKAVLAARSDGLKDLCNKKKKRGMTVTIESAKHQPFALFIQLLYTGKVRVDAGSPYDHLVELLHQYRLRFKDRRAFSNEQHIITIPDISLRMLSNARIYDDVVFRVGPHKIPFHAHRSILCARSSVFLEMFADTNEEDDTMSPGGSAEMLPPQGYGSPGGPASPTPAGLVPPIHGDSILIPNVQPENFKIMLDFIYDGLGAASIFQTLVAKQMFSTIAELLQLSHTYRVYDLKVHCEQAIFTSYLSEENVLPVYELACSCEAVQLKQGCASLIYDLLSSNKLSTQAIAARVSQNNLQELWEHMRSLQNTVLVGTGDYGINDIETTLSQSFDESADDMSISESSEDGAMDTSR